MVSGVMQGHARQPAEVGGGDGQSSDLSAIEESLESVS